MMPGKRLLGVPRSRLACRDPDAPCDEITEALINLLMDAMLSQNFFYALDHFCANHKIVPT